MYVERVTAAVLRWRVAGTGRVALGLRVARRRVPAAQLAPLTPQGAGAQERQDDGQHEAPEVPVVEEQHAQHVVVAGQRNPRRTGRCVQVAAALGAAFLRRKTRLATFAQRQRRSCHLCEKGR